VPRKNLRQIGGVSLIQRAVGTCLASEVVAEVYVSTEDQEIAQVASFAGATVIQRPWHLATDEASTHDVLIHALDWIDPEPSILAWVQCTAPLLLPAEIDGCVCRLLETEADVAIAAVEFHGAVMRETLAGRVCGVGWDLEEPVKRRQDQPRQWQVAGSVWAMDVQRLRKRDHAYSGNCVVYPVPRMVDVDSPDDLRLAEILLTGGQPAKLPESLAHGYPL
jgi:N-acylneuraminate cytidylyltransferase